MTIASILALAAAIGAQPPSEVPDDNPERPFTVFVFASASGEAQKDRDLLRAVEVVRKRIAARKAWFRIVADPKDAQVVVEVQSHSVTERLTMWASTGTIGGQLEGATRYSITEQHFLEAKVTLLGEELSLKTFDSSKKGSLKGAASGLALELESECQKRYAKSSG
jgi:ribosomal protein RSM22 (predicted rRNA methylase)